MVSVRFGDLYPDKSRELWYSFGLVPGRGIQGGIDRVGVRHDGDVVCLWELNEGWV